MLGINIFLFYSYISFLDAFEGAGPLLIAKNIAATLLLPMTYTFMVFFILNVTSEDKKIFTCGTHGWKCILSIIPYFLFSISIVFILLFLISNFEYSNRLLLPLFFFISAFFIMIFSEILYFIFESSSIRNLFRHKADKKRLFVTAIVLMVIIGNITGFYYSEKVVNSYPYRIFLSGNLIYEENESNNTMAVFSIELSKPEKLNFKDVHISVMNENGERLNITYSFSDMNSDGSLDTGDEISITLTDDEFSSGYRIFIFAMGFPGEIVYEF